MTLRELAAYARQQGITALVGTVAYENTRMLRFVRSLGLPTQMSAMARGELDIEIDLPGVAEPVLVQAAKVLWAIAA